MNCVAEKVTELSITTNEPGKYVWLKTQAWSDEQSAESYTSMDILILLPVPRADHDLTDQYSVKALIDSERPGPDLVFFVRC